MAREMIATNFQGVFSGTTKPVIIPKVFARKPKDHESFEWESSDGTKSLIANIDDYHLEKLYNKLVRSIMFMSELYRSGKTPTVDQQLIFTVIYDAVMHVGYEMRKRFHNEKYDSNPRAKVFEEIQNGSQIYTKTYFD